MTSYYECHVTLICGCPFSSDELKKKIEAYGWRFSRIDGDIVEGDGVKCYATRHFKSYLPVSTVVNAVISLAALLSACGYTVTRRKVEHVIYDDRSSKVCPEDCIECLKPQE